MLTKHASAGDLASRAPAAAAAMLAMPAAMPLPRYTLAHCTCGSHCACSWHELQRHLFILELHDLETKASTTLAIFACAVSCAGVDDTARAHDFAKLQHGRKSGLRSFETQDACSHLRRQKPSLRGRGHASHCRPLPL